MFVRKQEGLFADFSFIAFSNLSSGKFISRKISIQYQAKKTFEKR